MIERKICRLWGTLPKRVTVAQPKIVFSSLPAIRLSAARIGVMIAIAFSLFGID
jgi:hypothetical protein